MSYKAGPKDTADNQAAIEALISEAMQYAQGGQIRIISPLVWRMSSAPLITVSTRTWAWTSASTPVKTLPANPSGSSTCTLRNPS